MIDKKTSQATDDNNTPRLWYMRPSRPRRELALTRHPVNGAEQQCPPAICSRIEGRRPPVDPRPARPRADAAVFEDRSLL